VIEEWTGARSAEEVMGLMQRAGVAAGAALNGRDLGENDHLNTRGFYKELVHAEIGRHRYLLPPFRFSKTPGQPRMPAPCLGQHNEYVCKHILGMSDDEFVGLLNRGVLD
jgi:benzylsuccinate CoA-transferase BbsF subunit